MRPVGADGLALPTVQELPSWVSADGCDFYFSSNVTTGMGTDLYVVTRGQTTL